VIVAELRKQPGVLRTRLNAIRTSDPFATMKLWGVELQTDWVDFTVAGGEHRQNRWLAPMRLMRGRNRWLVPMRLMRGRNRWLAPMRLMRTKPLASADAANSVIAFDCL
jgi:hypothetical protein